MRSFITALLIAAGSPLLLAQYAGHWHLGRPGVRPSPTAFAANYQTLDVSGDTLAVFDALRVLGLPDQRGQLAREDGPATTPSKRPRRNLDVAEGRLYPADWLAKDLPPYLLIASPAADSLTLSGPDGHLYYTGRRIAPRDDAHDRALFYTGHCPEYYGPLPADALSTCLVYPFEELTPPSLPECPDDRSPEELTDPHFSIHLGRLPVVRKVYGVEGPHSGYGISVARGEVIPLGQRSIADVNAALQRAAAVASDDQRRRLTALIYADAELPAFVIDQLEVQLRKAHQLRVAYATAGGGVVQRYLPVWSDADDHRQPDLTYTPIKRDYEFPTYRKQVGLRKVVNPRRLNTHYISGPGARSLLIELTEQAGLRFNGEPVAPAAAAAEIGRFLDAVDPTSAVIYYRAAARAPFQDYLSLLTRIDGVYRRRWEALAQAAFGRPYPADLVTEEDFRIRRAVWDKLPYVVAKI